MKETELMIGDWVKINNQLYQISPYLLIEIKNGKYTIEPIPLTEEILEKNKMKIFEHRNPWQVANNLIKKWYSKDGSFYVSYYRVGDMFTYTLGTNLSRICNIKYVHELQHGLKLCKINKEIVL